MRKIPPVIALVSLALAPAALAQVPSMPTPRLVAQLGRMTPAAFTALLPDAGVRICGRQADSPEQVLASVDTECHTVTAAQVTPAFWRSELRDQVNTRGVVRCVRDGATERCSTPPVHNEPPGGRLWFFTGVGAARKLERVVTWSIDY